MGIKSLDGTEVCISAKAGLDHPYLIALTSLPTGDWEIATVKTSYSGDTRDGKRLKLITITFVVDTSEQLETMSSIKS